MGNRKVVRDDRYGRDDILNERFPSGTVLGGSEFDTDEYLRDRYRGNSNVILIVDNGVKFEPIRLGVDEERGVQEDQAHERSSISIRIRSSRIPIRLIVLQEHAFMETVNATPVPKRHSRLLAAVYQSLQPL